MPDISKISFNGNVLMDLTNDTVNPNNLIYNKTAHDASGKRIVGEYTGDEPVINLELYAVGDIFVTTRYGNPATLLGYGTWSQIKDKFLLAAGDTYTAGSIGGEAEHTLTIQEMPVHAGHLYSNDMYPSGKGNTTRYLPITSLTNYGQSGRGWNDVNGGEAYPVGVDRGEDQAHNNMPPYLAVYTWLRTA